MKPAPPVIRMFFIAENQEAVSRRQEAVRNAGFSSVRSAMCIVTDAFNDSSSARSVMLTSRPSGAQVLFGATNGFVV